MGCLQRAHCGSAAIAPPFPCLTIWAIILRSSTVGQPPFSNIAVAASRPAAHARGCRRRCVDDGAGADHAVKELESEIVTAVADRLRDDHGYELVAKAGAGDSGTRNEHALHPAGSIIVDSKPGALRVELHGVKVDAHDLFTGVSSELEQRHGGLRVEIG